MTRPAARCKGMRGIAVLAACLSFTPGCGSETASLGGPSGTPAPTTLSISSIAPSTSISGATITIFGTGFQSGLTVTLDGVRAEVLSVSSSSVTARTPDLAPGVVDVAVTNPSGQSATRAGGFTVTPFAVHTLAQTRSYQGSLFFLSGAGLIQGTIVKFGGVNSPLVFATPIGLAGIIPAHGPGLVDITVTHPAGKTLTMPNALTFMPSPVMTVSELTVTAGTQVTVVWAADPVYSLDFITLYRENAPHEDSLTAQLVPVLNTSGSMTFTAPSTPGRYEFRYLPYEGQWGAMSARSNVFTVTAATSISATLAQTRDRALLR